MLKSFRLTAVFVFVLIPTLSFAQSNYTDSVTITTYYPAPFGVYKNLRLHPTEEPKGNAVQEGVMYYNKTEEAIYYHNSSTWVKLGAGGGGGGIKIVKYVSSTQSPASIEVDCGEGWRVSKCAYARMAGGAYSSYREYLVRYFMGDISTKIGGDGEITMQQCHQVLVDTVHDYLCSKGTLNGIALKADGVDSCSFDCFGEQSCAITIPGAYYPAYIAECVANATD